MQPLHIFEPRYREMTADALAGDRYIALVLPLPGWEETTMPRPPAASTPSLAWPIVAEQRLDDGRFNILLRGFARIRILKELATKKTYRIARTGTAGRYPTRRDLATYWRQILLEKSPGWFPESGGGRRAIPQIAAQRTVVGNAVRDIIAFALPLDAEFKQSLLEELGRRDPAANAARFPRRGKDGRGYVAARIYRRSSSRIRSCGR